MFHSSSLTSSFGSELLALRSVLKATINAIQGIHWSDNSPSASSTTHQQDQQLHELSQHLKQLHDVGLKLSARWHRNSNLSEDQAALMALLSYKLLNLLDALSSTLDRLEQCGFKLEQATPLHMIEQAGEDVVRVLEETTDLRCSVGKF